MFVKFAVFATAALLAAPAVTLGTALLAACAATHAETPVHVATVDHGLRPDTAAEARAVADNPGARVLDVELNRPRS